MQANIGYLIGKLNAFSYIFNLRTNIVFFNFFFLGNSTENCTLKMDKVCSKNKIRAVKVVRSAMEEIAFFLHKNKECVSQIKLLHLMRDPRGKLNSYDICCGFNYSNKISVFQMCERQMKDVEIRLQLEKLYPGTLMEVQYEDLAADVLNVSEKIYSFLFKSIVPYPVKKWINISKIKTSKDNFSTNRKDPKATSLQWKKQISTKAERIVKLNCKNLLNHMVYKKYGVK